MNGSEFKAALKLAGYTQTEFAKIMGVHRETIGKQCHAATVEPCWVMSLSFLMMKQSLYDAMEVITLMAK